MKRITIEEYRRAIDALADNPDNELAARRAKAFEQDVLTRPILAAAQYVRMGAKTFIWDPAPS